MKKTSKIKVALIYANAIYESAKDHNALVSEVKNLIEIISKDNALVDFLANPIIEFGVKKQALGKMGFSKTLHNSLEVVVENNRANDLLPILKEVILVYYKNNNIVEVDVSSTYLLKKPQVDKLVKKMEQKTHKNVIINNIVDAQILGGLVIKYNSDMLDASILGKLKSFEKIMKGENS